MAEGGAAGLAKGNDGAALGLERGGEAAELGGLAGAVEALKSDEIAARHRLKIIAAQEEYYIARRRIRFI